MFQNIPEHLVLYSSFPGFLWAGLGGARAGPERFQVLGGCSEGTCVHVLSVLEGVRVCWFAGVRGSKWVQNLLHCLLMFGSVGPLWVHVGPVSQEYSKDTLMQGRVVGRLAARTLDVKLPKYYRRLSLGMTSFRNILGIDCLATSADLSKKLSSCATPGHIGSPGLRGCVCVEHVWSSDESHGPWYGRWVLRLSWSTYTK